MVTNVKEGPLLQLSRSTLSPPGAWMNQRASLEVRGRLYFVLVWVTGDGYGTLSIGDDA